MTAEEIHALAEQYMAGEITAKDYFAACHVFASELVEREMRAQPKPRRRRKRCVVTDWRDFLARFDGIEAPDWETADDLSRLSIEAHRRSCAADADTRPEEEK